MPFNFDTNSSDEHLVDGPEPWRSARWGDIVWHENQDCYEFVGGWPGSGGFRIGDLWMPRGQITDHGHCYRVTKITDGGAGIAAAIAISPDEFSIETKKRSIRHDLQRLMLQLKFGEYGGQRISWGDFVSDSARNLDTNITHDGTLKIRWLKRMFSKLEEIRTKFVSEGYEDLFYKTVAEYTEPQLNDDLATSLAKRFLRLADCKPESLTPFLTKPFSWYDWNCDEK